MNSRPRIALLTHGLTTGGGVPTVARWLTQRLVADGRYTVEVLDLATSSTDTASRRIAAPNTWFRTSLRANRDIDPPHQHWGANAVELEAMRYRPRRELTSALTKYDLIQIVSGSPAWGAVAKTIGVPVVIQAATMAAWEREALLRQEVRWRKGWRTAMTRLTTATEWDAMKAAAVVMVENRNMMNHLQRGGIKKVVLAPPGVDTDYFYPGTHKRSTPGYLLSVCRLGDPRKGLRRMIRAYSILRKLNPSTPDLVLAGRGRLNTSVEQEISRLGIESKIHVRSDIPSAALPELYRSSVAFLQTSYEEGLGMSLMEAMASGVPAVASDTAGSREIVINGKTGWLVNQDPTDDFEERFAVASNNLLKGNHADFARVGRQHCVETFSNDVAFERFGEIYESLLKATI